MSQRDRLLEIGTQSVREQIDAVDFKKWELKQIQPVEARPAAEVLSEQELKSFEDFKEMLQEHGIQAPINIIENGSANRKWLERSIEICKYLGANYCEGLIVVELPSMPPITSNFFWNSLRGQHFYLVQEDLLKKLLSVPHLFLLVLELAPSEALELLAHGPEDLNSFFLARRYWETRIAGQ
jgi:hypothetical protein